MFVEFVVGKFFDCVVCVVDYWFEDVGGGDVLLEVVVVVEV